MVINHFRRFVITGIMLCAGSGIVRPVAGPGQAERDRGIRQDKGDASLQVR